MHSKKVKNPIISFFSSLSLLQISLTFNGIFVMIGFYHFLHSSNTSSSSMMIRGEERTWHGGHPIAKDHKGSCWCGAEDQYCMCTPNVAIDLILVDRDSKPSSSTSTTWVWLVQRKDTNQLATMGGFVNVGETVEQAVHRELQEEMGIILADGDEQIQLLGVYSDPKRDNRRRNVSVVFLVYLQHEVHPKASDDAKDVAKINLNDIEDHDFFADHKTILLDYRQSLLLGGGGPATVETLRQTKRDDEEALAALDIQRSVCTTSKQRSS